MAEDFHKQKTLPGIDEDDEFGPIPDKIGPYKIDSFYAKGGMSYLFFARHPITGKTILLKVLPPAMLKDKENIYQFVKEAHVIEKTNHPNIVKLYGEGKWERGFYIAMEFIQGVSLRQFIIEKSLWKERSIEIILQTAYALCHLHTHGVIHRDLKPENILITEDGNIKIIDFGLVQLLEEPPSDRIGMVIGTPTYMSPEQNENPYTVTPATDIFALGMIAYELLTGKYSYGVVHLNMLPEKLRPIIGKAIHKDVKERYADIVDFITDLSSYLQELKSNPEEEKEEASNELFQMLETAKAILTPKKAPQWAQAEIGLATHEGITFDGIYIDFFHLPQNKLLAVMGEPAKPSMTALFQTAVLRGLFRMSLEPFYQTEKPFHPVQLLNKLNQAIHTDPVKQEYSFSFLLLDSDRDALSFVSCKSSPLIHIPEKDKALRLLKTPNPAIGINPDVSLLETADNWNAGDVLILHSTGLLPQKEEEEPNWMKEYLVFPPQKQAEKILRKLSKTGAKRSSAVLVIQRAF